MTIYRNYAWPSQAIAPAPAGSGEVWLLTHTYVHGGLETMSKPYVDPVKAIGDLAAEIRPRWSRMTRKSNKPEGMPDTPPVNDFEAVAWFFADPYPFGHPWHETFELSRARIDADVVRSDGPEYALSQAYQEMLCVCGNVSSNAGFSYVDEHGRDVVPGSDWLRCGSCNRLLHAMTGRVVKKIPTGTCATCADFIIAVSPEGLFLGEGYPYIDGDLVWLHSIQDQVLARCSGGNVAAPADTEARRCGQCGGDRADWPHRHAAQHLRSVWLPEHAASHPES